MYEFNFLEPHILSANEIIIRFYCKPSEFIKKDGVIMVPVLRIKENYLFRDLDDEYHYIKELFSNIHTLSSYNTVYLPEFYPSDYLKNSPKINLLFEQFYTTAKKNAGILCPKEHSLREILGSDFGKTIISLFDSKNISIKRTINGE